MSEKVASLACATRHPDLGWACTRRRHHTGDHMGTDDQGHRHTWADGEIGWHLPGSGPFEATPGTFEGSSLETLPPPPGYTPLNVWWLSLFVVFWLCAPAVVLLVWRIALR
jgi:hypothetical protein